MSSPIENLGKLMRQMTKQAIQSNKVVAIETGTIGVNRSLLVDSLGENQIPKGEYMIADHIKTSSLYQPGARVLVAWAGAEPIVIDIIVRS